MRNRIIEELLRRHTHFRPQLILDVGANVGQSVGEFRSAFPDARILAFEPVPATFEILQAAVAKAGNAEAHNIALGSSGGEIRMTAKGTSTGNRIIGDVHYVGETIAVPVETGDAFCARSGIDRIGFLKIDAEGYDLQVAAGFAGMLREARIDMIQLEIGLAPENRIHVPFESVSGFLHALDYRLFRLVGLHGNRALTLPPNALSSLFYADAVFIRNSATLADRAR